MDVSIHDVKCAQEYYHKDSTPYHYLGGVVDSMESKGTMRLIEETFIQYYGTYAMKYLLNSK